MILLYDSFVNKSIVFSFHANKKTWKRWTKEENGGIKKSVSLSSGATEATNAS